MMELQTRATSKARFFRKWLTVFFPILLICVAVIVVLLVYQPVPQFRLVRFILTIVVIATLSGIMSWRYASTLLKLKAAEKALRRSLALKDAFMSETPTGLFVKDRAGKYLYANQAWRRVLDCDSTEVEGRTDYDFFPEPQAYKLLQQDEQVCAENKLLDFPEEMISAKGDEYFSVTKFPLTNSQGRIHSIGAIAANVTDRVLAEHALTETETRFKTLLNLAPNALIITDTDGQIELVNRMATVLFGRENDELLEMNFESLVPEQGRERYRQYRQRYTGRLVEAGTVEDLNLQGLRNAGELFPIEVSMSQIITEQGLRIMSIVRDVTTQIQSMAALEETTAKLQELNRQLEKERASLERRMVQRNE